MRHGFVRDDQCGGADAARAALRLLGAIRERTRPSTI
jgi:hypothetical protein